jgi:ankyrin repeat protein
MCRAVLNTINVRDGDGQTALLWATKTGQIRLVKRLLDRGGADPNIVNIYNQIPLL